MKKDRTNQMQIALRQVEQRLDDAARSEDGSEGGRLVACLSPEELERFLDAYEEQADLESPTLLPCAYDLAVVPGPETSQ